MLRKQLQAKFSQVLNNSSLKASNFNLLKATYLPEINSNLNEYEHSISKAKLIHIENKDENNVFATTFRSRVDNSKGTPHILEHLMCCGSEKYPVRDPFMSMTKRSLSTYMNAWTGSDFISFPFASVNQKDLLNLLDVYLDLMYKPLLREIDFQQEGWRLDLQEKPIIKGVVFNEMKGVYQESENMFHQYILESVLNNTEYQYAYGGDPIQIPNLQHQEVIKFYNDTINPSQSLFYLYGSIKPSEIFQKLDKYLQAPAVKQNFSAQTSQIKHSQEILKLPKNIDQNSTMSAFMSYSFKIKEQLTDNPVQALALSVLQYCLFENPTGLLYQKLISKGLAENICNMTGLETYGTQSLFNFAFKGVEINKKTLDQIVSTIDETLKDILTQGLPNDLVEACLHQTEIETMMPSSELGLKIFKNILNNYVHGKNIYSQLDISQTITELRQLIATNYFKELIENTFLKNEEKTIIFAQPENDYEFKLIEQEQSLTQALFDSLSQKEKESIKDQNIKLEEEQNIVSDPTILPTLKLSDIQVEVNQFFIDLKKKLQIIYHRSEIDNVPVYFVQGDVKGMSFVRIKFNIGNVTQGLRQYLQMFCTFLNQIGTENQKYEKFANQISLNATNFEAKLDSFCDPTDVNKTNTIITLKIGCLDGKIPNMFELLTEILTEPYFQDSKNMSTVLRNQSSIFQQDLIENSLLYAKSVANQGLRENQYINDVFFSSKFFVNYASKFNTTNEGSKYFYVDDFNFQMMSIMYHIMRQRRIEIITHTQQQEKVEFQLKQLIGSLRQKYEGFDFEVEDIQIHQDYAFKPSFAKKIIPLPTQVNYNVVGLQIPHFTHPDMPSLQVLGSLLSSTILHREIREKGGAYGAGNSVSYMKGVTSLWSYRDPHVHQTLQTFINSDINTELSQQNITEAKLQIFQRQDSPKNPQDKGIEEIIYGYTPEITNKMREQLLKTSEPQIKEVWEKYYYTPIREKLYGVSVFTNHSNEAINSLLNEGFNKEEFTT